MLANSNILLRVSWFKEDLGCICTINIHPNQNCLIRRIQEYWVKKSNKYLLPFSCLIPVINWFKSSFFLCTEQMFINNLVILRSSFRASTSMANYQLKIHFEELNNKHPKYVGLTLDWTPSFNEHLTMTQYLEPEIIFCKSNETLHEVGGMHRCVSTF